MNRPAHNSGFTLMELIVSVFIMSLVIMIVLPVFTSIMGTKRIMEQSGVRQVREAQALFSLMKSDLMAAFLSNRAGADKFIIENESDFEGNSRDGIYFTSFNSFASIYESRYSDQSEVGYYMRVDDDKKAFYRSVSTSIDEDIMSGGAETMLLDTVEYFDVVAYDGDFTEGNEFGSGVAAGGLEDDANTKFPEAIMISLGLKSDDGRVTRYETAFRMPQYISSRAEVKKPADGEKGAGKDKEKKGADGDGQEKKDEFK